MTWRSRTTRARTQRSISARSPSTSTPTSASARTSGTVRSGGQHGHFPFTAIASEDIDQFGTSQIGVNGQVSSSIFESFDQIVNFSVFDNSTPCTVKPRRELEIRDVSVVDDRIRTGPGGAWTFGKLMEDMAPTPADAPAMVEGMLTSFLTQQTVNSFGLPPRFGVQQRPGQHAGPGRDARSVAGAVPPARDRQPHRPQRRHDVSATTAGEGRFVFGFTPFGQTLQATLIIEYSIPATSKAESSSSQTRGTPSARFPSRPSSTTQPCRRSRSASRRAARRRDARTGAPSGRSARTISSRSRRVGVPRVPPRRHERHARSGAGRTDAGSELQLLPSARAVRRRQRAGDPRREAHRAADVPGRAVPGRQRRRLGLLHVAGAGREPRRRVTVSRATPATGATRSARRAATSSRSGRASRARSRSCRGSSPARM